MERADKINIVTLIMLLGMLIAIAYHYFMGAYAGKGYPYNTFLFVPHISFTDFYDVYRASASLVPYASWSIYFPFAYIFTYPLTIFTETTALLVFVALFLVPFLWISGIFLNTNNLPNDMKNVAILLFSYPILFNLDRGNYEALIFVLLFLFVLCHQRGKHGLAITCLAFAGAMKFYPLLFVQLYVAEKKYLHALAAVLATFVLMLASILLFNGPFMMHVDGHSQQMQEFFNTYIIGNRGMGHSHSFFSMLKLLIYFFVSKADIPGVITQYNLLNIYSLFCGCVLLLSFAALFCARNCPFWIKLALIVLPMVTLPYASNDYKLIHLLLPMYYFFHANEHRFDYWYAAAFGLLLIPKSYYYFPGITTDTGFADVSIAVLLNPMIMMMMLAAIITSQFSMLCKDTVLEIIREHVSELKRIFLFYKAK